MAGCERRFLEIGKRLAQKDHDVHIFTLRYNNRLSREEVIEGMNVHRYADSNNYISGCVRSFGGVLKYSLETFLHLFGQKFDVYYSNEWPMLHSITAKPVASPLVQEWCEVLHDSFKVNLLQQLLKGLGDHNVAVSEFTKHRLISFLKIDHRKIAVIPNGVDNSRYHCDSTDKVWGRIIYVGRLVPHKHIDMLIDAFCEVQKKVPDAELHVVGSGSSFHMLKNKASHIKNCSIHGFLPEDRLIDLLKSSWLFVLPSEREGSSIAILEGMAAGLPFITANYPNNAAKELAQFKCGLAVSPNASSLATAILQLLNDEKRWKEMNRNALRFAEKYDWDIVTDHMETYLQGIASGERLKGIGGGGVEV